MNIRQWVKNWLFKDLDLGSQNIAGNRISTSSPSEQIDQGFRFTVMPATGGKIVQVEQYDRRTSQHYSKLYIIGPDDKFGEEIEQIYAMEQLSR